MTINQFSQRCGLELAAKVLLTTLVAALFVAGCQRQDKNSTAPAPGEVAQHAPRQPLPGRTGKLASLVLTDGTIATVDKQLGTVEAMAIDGYRILDAGTEQAIAAYIGPQTRVIDLQGRFAMPGFIEGHGHFLYLGQTRQMLDLTTVSTWDEIVTLVGEAAQQAQPGDWITGFGWHQDKWLRLPESAVDGVPRNDLLSAAAPDNPVLLTHASGHASMANDAALAKAGIGELTPDPDGGTIVRTPQGQATGLLRETAQYLTNTALDQWASQRSESTTMALKREQADLAAQEALRHGVTSFHDAGTSFADIDFFKLLEAEGALPIRLNVMVRGESNEELDARLPDYRMPAKDNDFLTVRSIKRQIDGALGTHGAWLLEPYADLPTTAGLTLESVEDIETTAGIALKHGFQLNTHAIGDRANRETLNLYQRAFLAAGVDGRTVRWRIEHAQHLNPGDVPRFAELGVIASMQGVHATSDGPWLATRLGEQRAAETSYVWRNLIDAGAIINNGTDVPVESIDPIASFYSSVSRLMKNGKRLTPAMAMSREQALESYTINNAYGAFEEDIKGSLSPGKLADIVVLSRNILTVPEAEIPGTVVEITIVGGEVRYERGQSQ